MTDWLMIAVGVVLTVGTALFVAGEFSLVALDPSTVETRAATGDKRATTVQRALGRLSTLLSGAQVGISKSPPPLDTCRTLPPFLSQTKT